MSISSVSVISERIRSAQESSPIAVFTTPRGMYDAMLAGTAYANNRIQSKGKDLVGVFYGSSGVYAFRGKVRDSFKEVRV